MKPSGHITKRKQMRKLIQRMLQGQGTEGLRIMAIIDSIMDQVHYGFPKRDLRILSRIGNLVMSQIRKLNQ